MGERREKLTSKWSVLVVSSWSMSSEKMTRGSRMNRCAMWRASGASIPFALSTPRYKLRISKKDNSPCFLSRSKIAASYGASMSLYSGRFIQLSEMYKLTLSYRDFGMRNLFSFNGYITAQSASKQTHVIAVIMLSLTFNPRSSSVRSSTLAATTSHLLSTSAIYPLHSGLAAVNASYTSHRTQRNDYRQS